MIERPILSVWIEPRETKYLSLCRKGRPLDIEEVEALVAKSDACYLSLEPYDGPIQDVPKWIAMGKRRDCIVMTKFVDSGATFCTPLDNEVFADFLRSKYREADGMLPSNRAH